MPKHYGWPNRELGVSTAPDEEKIAVLRAEVERERERADHNFDKHKSEVERQTRGWNACMIGYEANQKEVEALRAEVERLNDKIKQDAWVKPKLITLRAENEQLQAYLKIENDKADEITALRSEVERLKASDEIGRKLLAGRDNSLEALRAEVAECCEREAKNANKFVDMLEERDAIRAENERLTTECTQTIRTQARALKRLREALEEIASSWTEDGTIARAALQSKGE